MSLEVVHAVPGRVRFRDPATKGRPALANTLREQLSTLAGVRRVETNPVTGSVLVLYEANRGPTSLGIPAHILPEAERAKLHDLLTRPSHRVAPRSSLPADRIANFFRGLNVRVGEATGGFDLKILVPAALLLLAVLRLLAGKRSGPGWHDLLWFSFAGFLMLNRPSGQ